MWPVVPGMVLFLVGLVALRVAVLLENYGILAVGILVAMFGVLHALGRPRPAPRPTD